MELVKLKRATVGQPVKSDIDVTGNWCLGRILEFNKTHITYAPADGSDIIKTSRKHVYKSTEDEVKKVRVINVNDVLATKKKSKLRDKSGLKQSKDNGDATARALRGLNLNSVYEYASEFLKIPKNELKNRYNHLNHGQQRMCIGNKLRGAGLR